MLLNLLLLPDDEEGVRAFVAVLLAASAWAGESQGPKWKRAWMVSAAAMTAASFLDAHSSRGLPESNPFLRNGQGQFSAAKGYALKSGATMGMALIQALAARRRPELYKPSLVLNWGAAGAFGVAAWRNRGLRGGEKSHRNLLGAGGGGQQSALGE